MNNATRPGISRIHWLAVILVLASLACGLRAAPLPDPAPSPEAPVPASSRTAYGFFPTPPEVSQESVLAHFRNLGEHADLLLLQEGIPWAEFAAGADAASQIITDLRNACQLARANGMDCLLIIDPLNGFNRREFMGLPEGWQASFANPDVRAAFRNYALRLAGEFQPRYLGLASEINTYMEAHPEDAGNFISLYQETYAAIKAAAPETQVFVTFQWEQVNNLVGDASPTGTRQINWQSIEIFEPQLDLWAISSYPFIVYRSGADIPADYYTPLLARTEKPLAVAEGGFISRPTNQLPGAPQDQVDYLNAIHTQIGGRLDFWIYLLLSDLNEDSYAGYMRQQGVAERDVTTLGFFVNVGLQEKDGKTPKPALALWDSFRK